MKFKSYSSGLAGTPNGWSWAQFYESLPDDPDLAMEKGNFLAVVQIGTNSPSENVGTEDLILQGNSLMSKLRENYFGGKSEGTLKFLKEVVLSTTQELSRKRNSQIGLVVQVKNVLYLVSHGGARFYLYRDGVLSQLLATSEGEIESASGYIRSDDILFGGTSYFFESFAGGRLKALLGSRNIKEVVEQLTPLVNSKENSSNMAMLLVKFEEEPVSADMQPKDLRTKFNPSENFYNFSKSVGGFLKRSLYVQNNDVEDEAVRKKKKVTASVGALLLVLLIVSIGFGIKQKKESDFKKSYEQDLASAKHNLDEAENLLNLNPDRSRELFLDARAKVLGLSQEIDEPEVLDLKKKIEDSQGRILGEYRKEVALFTDLGLLSDGFSGDDLVMTQNYLCVLDEDADRVIRISFSTKRAEVVAGPSRVDNASELTAYQEQIFVLSTEGIFEVTGSDKKKVIENTWQGRTFLHSYAGNIYVLEPAQSRILRYSGTGDEFSEGKDWLHADSDLGLADAVSWAIDGNIWILKRDGQILKLTTGNVQPFDFDSNLVGSFNSDFIFTSDEANNLYVLDRRNTRVLIFDKEGSYKSQHISDQISGTTQIAVSEEEGKIILLNGNKLFSLDL